MEHVKSTPTGIQSCVTHPVTQDWMRPIFAIPATGACDVRTRPNLRNKSQKEATATAKIATANASATWSN
eukprot:1938792-Prorocentrum_lima.AAC.1